MHDDDVFEDEGPPAVIHPGSFLLGILLGIFLLLFGMGLDRLLLGLVISPDSKCGI